MPIFTAEDGFLVEYAEKLVENNNSQVTFVDPNGAIKESPNVASHIAQVRGHRMMEDRTMKREFLVSQDIMIVSLDSWRKLVDSQSIWLSNIPSVLIVRP
jgi:adenosyl cobinamide kinase/adenosyl cobinamide phosphate guanylyltransferase